MATNQLTATASSGSQATTQSPQAQAVVQEQANGVKTGSVQPGTATALLNSQGGVPLHLKALSTINLANASPVTVTVPPAASLPKHHVNMTLFGLSGLMLLVAVVLFWAMRRSVKSTISY